MNLRFRTGFGFQNVKSAHLCNIVDRLVISYIQSQSYTRAIEVNITIGNVLKPSGIRLRYNLRLTCKIVNHVRSSIGTFSLTYTEAVGPPSVKEGVAQLKLITLCRRSHDCNFHSTASCQNASIYFTLSR